MPKPKPDVIVEAAHFTGSGELEWVRAYLRRGSVWSDRALISRSALIQLLKSKKRVLVGKRVSLMGATFEASTPVRLLKREGREILVTGNASAGQDNLDNVPLL